MKNLILILTFLLLANFLCAQSGIILLSKDTACSGETINAVALPPEFALATPTGTNNQNGYMFDISATHAATIKGFLISPVSSGATYYIYYRTGSHVGFENSSAGWTLIDSVTNVPAGTDVNPGFNINQNIVAGQTLAFYITAAGTNYTYYDNGTSVGTTLASDSYLTIKEGVGKSYPFGTSYSPRNFVGSVLYEPLVSAYSWNTGQTTNNVNIAPTHSEFLGCKLDFTSGFSSTAVTTLHHMELNIDVTADPSSIQSGQSSTLKASVMVDRGVATNPAGTNSQNGAMFDVVADDSLTINGFTVSTTLDTGTIDIEIFYKTGTHVGFEGNSSAWTSIGTYSNIAAGVGRYLSLNFPIDMVGGQTMAFYITSIDGKRLHYDNGSGVGNIFASAGGLKILEGTGVVYPFGTTYTPRVLNTIVHFTQQKITNANYSWSSGGSSGSILVSPPQTTTYTATVGVEACSDSGSVTVTVGVFGLDEIALNTIEVFPNPVENQLNIKSPEFLQNLKVSIYDLTGRLSFQDVYNQNSNYWSIPIHALPTGVYLLKLENDEGQIFSKKFRVSN